jgi:cysteine-rich repeat protein
MTATRPAISAFVALIGCTSIEAEDANDDGLSAGDLGDSIRGNEADDPPIPPPSPGLILRVVSGDGDVLPAIAVDKRVVHIRIFGIATAADVVDADYVFEVIDPVTDVIVSSDHPDCRRFHVNAFGRINAVYEGTDETGAACGHAFGIADNNSLVPQLIPFDDVPVDANGVMSYRVRIRPLEITDYSMITAFTIQPPPEPPAPVCGDGTVDPGEECDDGNTCDLDGCSATCAIETGCPAPDAGCPPS